MKSVVAVLLLVFSCAACSAPLPTASVHEAIINGTADTGDPNVVLTFAQVPGQMSGSLCTGEVVSPHVVLTAAHCMAPSTVGDGAKFIVFTGNALPTMGMPPADQILKVSESHFVSTFFYNSTNGSDQDDLGVLILAAPTTITPLPFNHFPLPTSFKGQAGRIVGYGLTNGNDTSGDTAGTKHQAPTVAYDFGGGTITLYDMMHSNCEGDSGGPALFTIDGKERIAGITQVGYVGCPVKMSGSDTLVDPYASFVDKYVDQFDPPAVGPGGACTKDSDCGSRPCISGVCAVACDPMAKTSTCPAGTTCSNVDGKDMCFKAHHGCDMGGGDSGGGGFIGLALAALWLLVRRRQGRVKVRLA
jgi:MYXO-CTERM domain-containing protein